MSNNSYKKASQAYQKNKDDALSPLQIVVELYKGMLKNVKLIKQARANNNFEDLANLTIKTFDILEALQSNLDMENGGEDAIFLNRFYTIVFSALSQASVKPDPIAYYDEIISYIQQVHDRWYNLAYPDASFEKSSTRESQNIEANAGA